MFDLHKQQEYHTLKKKIKSMKLFFTSTYCGGRGCCGGCLKDGLDWRQTPEVTLYPFSNSKNSLFTSCKLCLPSLLVNLASKNINTTRFIFIWKCFYMFLTIISIYTRYTTATIQKTWLVRWTNPR